jgi:hypothetical protein
MLQVKIIECVCTPKEWEWRICDSSGQPLMVGWQRSREKAKLEGDKALFRLLASGRLTNHLKD